MFHCTLMTQVWLVGLNTEFLKVTLCFGKIQREKMDLGQGGGKVWSVNLVCSDRTFFQ